MEMPFKFCVHSDKQRRVYYPMPTNAVYYTCLEMASLQRRREKERANHLSETAEQRKKRLRRQRDRVNRLL